MEAQLEKTTTPLLPWRTRLSINIVSRVTDAARRSNGTVNRRLLNLLELKTPPTPTTPINGVTSSDISVDPSRNLWFRLYNPTTTTATVPLIVFFHGGGFSFLSPDNRHYDSVCRRFARKIQAVVVSVNYRLAPENKYPAQYEDGFDVLKFLDDEANVKKYLPENADLSCCFLAGDSAGGNLSHHVALRACQYEFRKLKVMGVLAIQPFFGGEEITEAEKRLNKIDPLVSLERTEWMWKAFMPPHEGDRDHQVINVSGPKAVDISKLNFPPVLVVVGGFDSLQDWQRRYYEWLKKSGKEAYLLEYPTMVHAFYIFPELPQSAILISEMKEFMSKQLSKRGKL
ncbi:deacetylase [Lithospermum erythrorhizon]|uniref:Deacetylase n=1 Tax=Lithospermum erythrorhizon TaxID=34254 RepID=A0AAV3R594_LITER